MGIPIEAPPVGAVSLRTSVERCLELAAMGERAALELAAFPEYAATIANLRADVGVLAQAGGAWRAVQPERRADRVWVSGGQSMKWLKDLLALVLLWWRTRKDTEPPPPPLFPPEVR